LTRAVTLVVLTALFLATAVTLAAAGENVLYSYQTGDGCAPYGGIIADPAGNLFGTTYGTRVQFGTVYELTRGSDGTWTQTVLHTFAGGNDGRNPVEGLVRDQAGNLYGTVPIGGTGNSGAVFELSPVSGGGWTWSILYSFSGGNDGAIPYSTLTLDQAGNLYGTTSQGGATGNGVVYELAHGSSGWTETVLYAFNGTNDGSWPSGPLTFDQAGNLYGTTTQAGADGWGTAYKLAPTSNGWTASVLYTFTGAADGSDPEYGVVRDRNGILYGTATSGGTGESGVVFQLRPNPSAMPGTSNAWSQRVDYAFTGSDDGSGPNEGLAFDSAGNLNGTAEGGSDNYGVVYRMTPGSTGWQQSVLYTFTGGADGGFPESTVLADTNGNLLGTTIAGGANGCGVAYQITP
jgi:uncharacterized repeat protein (TIGR03803 family)